MVAMRKANPYYLHTEAKLARSHARCVKEYESRGEAGAWAGWQRFIGQWPVDSLERTCLVEVFCCELDMLDEEAIEYDPSMADIW